MLVLAETYCDPLGDYNVFAFVDALNSSEGLQNNSVNVLAARVGLISHSLRTFNLSVCSL